MCLFNIIQILIGEYKCVMIAGFWAFLWFVGFCFLANQWQRTTPDNLPLNQGADAARAAITFSFFSIFTWVKTQTWQLTINTIYKQALQDMAEHQYISVHCQLLHYDPSN